MPMGLLLGVLGGKGVCWGKERGCVGERKGGVLGKGFFKRGGHF